MKLVPNDQFDDHKEASRLRDSNDSLPQRELLVVTNIFFYGFGSYHNQNQEPPSTLHCPFCEAALQLCEYY